MQSKTSSTAYASESPFADSSDQARVVHSFTQSLQQSAHHQTPYDFWLFENALPEGMCAAIADLPFHAPSAQEANFDGRRNTNDNLRVYFNPGNRAQFPEVDKLAEGLDHPASRKCIEDITGADLTDTRLRVEFCQDTPGFWLEPHTDISVKKLSMLIYLLDDPDLAGTGTDILSGPPDHTHVMSAPYGRNKGVMFVPGDNTWHGAGHTPIPKGKVRKSLMINFVSADWRDKWELA